MQILVAVQRLNFYAPFTSLKEGALIEVGKEASPSCSLICLPEVEET